MDEQTLPPGQRARRRRIIDAASALLESQPYDAVQMKDVADRADVALGTMYRYFRSKEQLYAAVLEHWGSFDFEPAAADDHTAEERLRGRIDLLIASVERRPHFFTLEHALQSTTDPGVKARQQAWSRSGATWLAHELLASGDEAGRRAAEMLWAIVNHVLQQSTMHGAPYAEARATAHAFVDLLVAPFRLDAQATSSPPDPAAPRQ